MPASVSNLNILLFLAMITLSFLWTERATCCSSDQETDHGSRRWRSITSFQCSCRCCKSTRVPSDLFSVALTSCVPVLPLQELSWIQSTKEQVTDTDSTLIGAGSIVFFLYSRSNHGRRKGALSCNRSDHDEHRWHVSVPWYRLYQQSF